MFFISWPLLSLVFAHLTPSLFPFIPTPNFISSPTIGNDFNVFFIVCMYVCIYLSILRSVQNVQRHLLKKTQDTRNIIHRTMTPKFTSTQAPWYLTQLSHLPSAAPLYFPESHLWSEISSLSKVILVWGKARSHRVPNLGCRGLSHLGELMFHQKTLHKT